MVVRWKKLSSRPTRCSDAYAEWPIR